MALPFIKPVFSQNQAFARGEAHSFDVGAFEDAIHSQGVPLTHWRAMACPQGVKDKDDHLRRVHVDHENCSNGFLYKKIGTVFTLFSGNSAGPNFQDVGNLDGSTADVTFNRKYEDAGSEFYVSPFDRLYFSDPAILWPHWETVEHNITGRDRLRFPAERVETLIDNLLHEYVQGVDFDVDTRGGIVWKPDGKRPGTDPDSPTPAQGRVYVCWYLYRPYFYLQRLSHQIRVVQTGAPDGTRQLVRMPQAATLVRESVFESEQSRDDGKTVTGRESRHPADGSVPPT